MKTTRLAALAALVLSLPVLAQQAAAAAQGWRVKPEASTLSYKLHHKLHEVEGKARPTEGRARLLPDGTLQVAVRANVADFDSGNANRDAHMKEVTEAGKYPTVEYKGVASGVKLPTTFPAELPVTLKGQLTFHGEKQPVEVPLTVKFTSAKEAVADGTFNISLDAFKVERPSLMMVKVDDALVLQTHLALTQEGP
jgi:polyisoprenoid-binding protein YceI